MTSDGDGIQHATPTLMRAARGVYAQSMRAQLQALGADDLPRNGAFLLAGIESGESRGDLPGWLGISRQAVSQAVDALVERGYVLRGEDAVDRRRVRLQLTPRGREVLAACARGVEAVDAQITQTVSAEQLAALRSTLLAMADLKVANQERGAGLRPRRAVPQLHSFSPIFPVRDLAAALAHYRALGFQTKPYEDGGDYGFADRDGLGLHFTHDPDHLPTHGSGMAYLYVSDADALHAEWTAPEVGGRTRPVADTPYGLREGSHVDPDGNLIRFGSPIAEG
jgi:DNA-binding MarR family transcriptional regulator/catechol 2,3-dioxygenase-like lactoylglutathione lyase family enzyme